MKKKCLFIIVFIIFNNLSLFAQQKTIEIHIPNIITKVKFDGSIAIYKITTDESGIIKSITAKNDPYFKEPKVIKNDNKITNTTGIIEDIKWENDIVYIKGGIYKKNNDYMKVVINPQFGVLYEHEELKLIRLSDKSLEEQIKKDSTDHFAYIYDKNILYRQYKFKNNISYKFYFKKINKKISVTCYYEDDKYSQDIEIYGDNIYSNDMAVNVINYYILSRYILQPILFPILFLENPFEDVAGK